MTEQRNDTDEGGIDYFNRGHWLSNIHAKMSLDARRRHVPEIPRVRRLCCGVDVCWTSEPTPDTERADSNCMILWFAEAGMRVSRAFSLVRASTWAREEHLNLIGARDLKWITRQAIDADFTWTMSAVWALGMPSNLILLARRTIAR